MENLVHINPSVSLLLADMNDEWSRLYTIIPQQAKKGFGPIVLNQS